MSINDQIMIPEPNSYVSHPRDTNTDTHVNNNLRKSLPDTIVDLQ